MTLRDLDRSVQVSDHVAPGQTATVVCTLGMHRSGTSLVSRLLNLLGVYLGEPHTVSQAGWDNPKGYWEHHPLALLNDEILSRFGGQWDQPPVFPHDWPRDPRLTDLRDQARQLLRDNFAAVPVWGWKDPRTCLTLPFWQDLVGAMRYVICIRNPCAVIASLGRRNRMSAEKAERLWLAHVQSSLIHTSGQPRLFVFYEDVIHDWRAELRRLATLVGRPERAEDPDLQAMVAEFLDEELCHHRMTISDLVSSGDISFATKSLYHALHAEAGRGARTGDINTASGHGRGIGRNVEMLATSALETFDERAATSTRTEALTRDNASQLDALETQRAAVERLSGAVASLTDQRDALDRARETAFAATAAIIGERDRLIAAATVTAGERDRLAAEVDDLRRQALTLAADRRSSAAQEALLRQSVTNLQIQLQTIRTERDRQDRDYRGLAFQLQTIETSRAWRLVVFARRRMVAWLPAGTTRRRLFDALTGRLAQRADTALRSA
jgi:hypothetical protein